MTEEIIIKHSNFIKNDSGIKENLENLITTITNNDESFLGYIDYLNKQGENISSKEIVEFLNVLIKHTTETDNNKNLFVASPQKLNNILQDLEKENKNVFELIGFESKNKKDLEGYKLLSEEIYKAFGYESFSGAKLNVDRTHYNHMKDLISLKKVHKKPIFKKDKFYDYTKIKKFLLNELKKFKIEENLKDLFNEATLKIKDIDEIEYNRFKNEVNSAFSQYLTEYKEEFLDISNEVTIDNYLDYLEKKHITWNAYSYVMKLGLKTCPYCNRQYITPLYSEKGKVRGDLDHFYPKSKYPFFSMSIYNLIPCCKFCNSSLKGATDFSYKSNLNPLDDGFGENLKFRFELEDIELSKNLDLKVVLSEEILENKTELMKNNAKEFKLETLYNYHIDEVRDLILKKVVYNESYINELRSTLKEVLNEDVTNERIVEFIINNSIDENKLHERTLSKLYKDIVEQLNFFTNENNEPNSIALKRILDNIE